MRIWWCQEHLTGEGDGVNPESVFCPGFALLEDQTKDCRLVPMRLIPDNGDDYMNGRLAERRSILGWLKAEAENETLPSYRNAHEMLYTALSHIVDTSEMHGLMVRPIAEGDQRYAVDGETP